MPDVEGLNLLDWCLRALAVDESLLAGEGDGLEGDVGHEVDTV